MARTWTIRCFERSVRLVRIADGFEHERIIVVPRPLVAAALARPLTRKILVTDCGLYPRAAGHSRSRPDGAPETIVLVCTAGSGWLDLGGTVHRIGSATVAVVAGGIPHSYHSSEEHPWTIWWCHVRGDDVAELVTTAGLDCRHPIVSLRDVGKVVALIDEMTTGLGRDTSPLRLLAAAGAAWKMFTQIAVDKTLPASGDPFQQAISYVSSRLDVGVRVPELAAMVGVSASHLTALFRASTGGGVVAFHTGLRMAQARRLLDSTRLSIADVGSELGYHDAFYFSRQFHRVNGMSPSEYRRHPKG
jgi:AraC family transcriptional regulator of arabinose operon